MVTTIVFAREWCLARQSREETSMRLIEQFRVSTPDGNQHTVACYQESAERHGSDPGPEGFDGGRSYRLNGAETINRIDTDTFRTAAGVVLQRARRAN